MHINAQDFAGPDTVAVRSGELVLKGLFWRPSGTGPFPTVLFCHGNYGEADTADPVRQSSILGPVFSKEGYGLLLLFRRGVGLSQSQGVNSAVLMDRAFKEKGQKGRNFIQIQQLETDQMQDMIAGISFLRKRKEVDLNHIGVVGHSFGGSLALLLASHEPKVKAVVVFAAAGYSWNLNPELRTRLISAVKKIKVPVMLIHAQNDYSTVPGYSLDSVMKKLNKPHLLKIYPAFGNSLSEGHNFIFLSTATWEADIFRFLHPILQP